MVRFKRLSMIAESIIQLPIDLTVVCQVFYRFLLTYIDLRLSQSTIGPPMTQSLKAVTDLPGMTGSEWSMVEFSSQPTSWRRSHLCFDTVHITNMWWFNHWGYHARWCNTGWKNKSYIRTRKHNDISNGFDAGKVMDTQKFQRSVSIFHPNCV